VAGATGRLGLRIVRELLLAGFKVRAGARNTDKAQEYAELAVKLGVLSKDVIKRLQIVVVDLEETDTIVAAIGNAGKVRTINRQAVLFPDGLPPTDPTFLPPFSSI
jgi:uncharacterized protein YbjT (DUF2867 family)